MASSVRVLVVEDTDADAAVIRDQLIAQEYDVETISDARRAYDKILVENGYDLLVFNVSLPGIDGVTLAKRLRQADILTPVLFISSGISTNVRLSITNMGPSVAFLEKGTGQEILIATCTELLARNHLVLQLTRQDQKLTELKEIFLERIPKPEDLSVVVATQLDAHCPAKHEALKEEFATKEDLEDLDSSSVDRCAGHVFKVESVLEEATSVDRFFKKVKDHSLSKVVAVLLGTIGTLYGGFTAYTYFLADGASREVIQVRSDVEVFTVKIENRMTQQTAQMSRIEQAVAQLLPSPTTPPRTVYPTPPPTATVPAPGRVVSP